MLLPNLFQYSDYRQFLKDAYAMNKTKQASFSFRYLALKGGVNSSAFFKYIFEGQRNLTKGTLLKTCLAFGLKDKDAEYFEHLVFFNQAKTMKEKNLYFDKLTKLRGLYDVKRVEESQFDFYSQWYHSVIRELLAIVKPSGDPKALAHALLPSITPKQAQESIDLLHRLGFIHKDAQGKWRQRDPILSTGNPITSQVVIQFQLKMLELAGEAYDRSIPEERLMSSTTLAVSEASVDLFKKKIRQFRAELLELARVEESPERVYQLNLNFFPTSRKTKE
ncbi:MAG: TIGR02147 family protein [Fibrobacteria bacterium]